ncbi:RidA family protein [Chelativorans sp. Marseille-P2723]|uniref:RidA family protein n=1 Tax=Chelativorans sp. Marseille-P2723 TaxID=2709133 RepID=UPI0015706C0F|nr:RidA family protein [Chelativorans sp. Marseille-P2723]
MNKDISLPKATGVYSPALRIGDWIYVSGQGPIDDRGNIVAGSFEDEMLLTLKNIQRLVEAAGGEVNRITKCTCYLSNIANFNKFDEIYGEFFRNAEVFPARTTVAAELDRIQIEIDAVAYVGKEIPIMIR